MYIFCINNATCCSPHGPSCSTKIYMCELNIINLPEVEELFPSGAELRIFGAVHELPRVLSRRKLGKRNIYFSPNNS